jgi:hypothetical protein
MKKRVAKVRAKDSEYWADVRADALRIISEIAGPEAAKITELLKAKQTEEDDNGRKLNELQRTIDQKRKDAGIRLNDVSRM